MTIELDRWGYRTPPKPDPLPSAEGGSIFRHPPIDGPRESSFYNGERSWTSSLYGAGIGLDVAIASTVVATLLVVYLARRRLGAGILAWDRWRERRRQ